MKLGFIPSREKSDIVPSQDLVDQELHGGCIYQQPERHTVSVLSEEQHSPFSEACSRQAQRVVRHSLPGSQADRVDSLPSSVQFGSLVWDRPYVDLFATYFSSAGRKKL